MVFGFWVNEPTNQTTNFVNAHSQTTFTFFFFHNGRFH